MDNRLQEVPLQVGAETQDKLEAFVVDGGGTPWAVLKGVEHKICYLENGSWHAVHATQDKKISLHLWHGKSYAFVSASYRHDDEQEAELSELRRSGMKEVARLHAEDRDDHFLHVDLHGRVWNWGRDFVARHDGDGWTYYEGDFNQSTPAVFEDGHGTVYFVSFQPRGTAVYSCVGGRYGCCDDLPAYRYHLEEPFRQVQALPWGENSAIVHGEWSKNLAVLDFEDLRLRQHAFDDLDLTRRSIEHISTDCRRNVYLWLGFYRSVPDPGPKGCCVKLDAQTGKLVEIPFDWVASRPGNSERSLLATDGGRLFVASRKEGLYVYRDGKTKNYLWPTGHQNPQMVALVEGSKGQVWCATGKGLFLYGAVAGAPATRSTSGEASVSPQLSPRVKCVDLSRDVLIRDQEYRIWAFLKDCEGSICRFDGREWKKFPLDLPSPPYGYSMAVDERNKVYVPHSNLDEGQTWRVGPDGVVESFTSTKEMYLRAIANGATRFRSAGSVIGPLVRSDGNVWLVVAGYEIQRFNGHRWQRLYPNTRVAYMTVLPDGHVGFCSRSGAFQVFDAGRFVEYDDAHTRRQECLVSEDGIDVFGRHVLTARKGMVFPARFDRGNLLVFETLGEFLSPAAEPAVTVDRERWQSDSFTGIRPSPDGGFWSINRHGYRDSRAIRVWQGLRIEIGPDALPSNQLNVRNIYEDAARNLWIVERKGGPSDLCAYVIGRPTVDTQIETKLDRATAGESVTVSFSGSEDGKPCTDLLFAWRVNEGKWSAPSPDADAEFEVPRSGKYVFEVAAIGEHASIDTTPARLEFAVEPGAELSVTELMEMFYSADWDRRERAVRECKIIGDSCVPDLEAALTEAPPDVAWWITAALAQIKETE